MDINYKFFDPERHADNIFSTLKNDKYDRFWVGLGDLLTRENMVEIENILGEDIIIAEDNTGKFLGMARINHLPLGIKEIAILVDENNWHCGVGSRILHFLISFAQLSSTKVLKTQCAVNDAASNKALKKAGFIMSGRLPKHTICNGKTEDVNVYCLEH